MNYIMPVIIAATLLTCVPNRQCVANEASRFSVPRSEEAAKRISQPLVLEKVARPFLPETETRDVLEESITPQFLRNIQSVQSQATFDFQEALVEDSRTSKTVQDSTAFGPHLLVSSQAQEIAQAGEAFLQASTTAAKQLNVNGQRLRRLTRFRPALSRCPFNVVVRCNPDSKYRTIDGSCNNLANPLWGRANTPFDRFLPPQYDDGIQSPRSKSISGQPLPNARVISTRVHKKSTVANLHPDITHLTMEFGQLISHDVNRNTLSSGYGGGSLTCCRADGSVDNSRFKKLLGCLPIELPENDPFFKQYGRTCMNFVRAAPTTDMNCDLGFREQLNQVTHYIDASTVYGSDTKTMNDVRLKRDGLLKVTSSSNGDLLLQNPRATGTPGCRNTAPQHCFKAGDVRANQQPGLMTLHTIFLREHNRIARKLKSLNPLWNDERLFQEARKIVGAEIQHVTYNEYLPTILGNTFATRFGFAAQPAGQYFTGYKPDFNPAIRNGFAAAGYRFGHSTVRDHVAVGSLFKDHFLNPSLMYQSSIGPSFLAKDLYTHNQQSTDNLMTTQLTNHLFERGPGTGIDLAATNIQRGRDHGIGGYNIWRLWCQLEAATTFNAGTGGLIDHSPAVVALLKSVYNHPDDIDLWTGIVTETPLEGLAVGPTGACMIGRQFWVLKHADRFYYETNDATAKFKIEQLDEIKKTSLARIICDNTGITSLPRDVFEELSTSNPNVKCSNLPEVDLSQWSECVDGGWSSWSSYSKCVGNFRIRTRSCTNPPKNACGKTCLGSGFQLKFKDCSPLTFTFPITLRPFPPSGPEIISGPHISDLKAVGSKE